MKEKITIMPKNKAVKSVKVNVKSVKNVKAAEPFEVQEHTLDLGNFEQILHISDVHIRPLQRHQEFTEVFHTVDTDLKQLCKTPSIIAVTGDVFDSKTIFKPETFKVCRDFFKLLSSHCPVILIAGNHDMLEKNLNRLDALTPVVDDIENLHYLKYSGVYHSKETNHTFVVSSLYDKQFIQMSDLTNSKDRRYVALYHGTLSGASTDLGFEINDDTTEDSSRYRSLKDFKDFDAVLLGDIHKHQIMTNNTNALVAYAGSLIQQSHGESLENHGILCWDKDLKPVLHPINNTYGFVDVYCENGEWSCNYETLPDNCYARLIIKNCTNTQIDLIVAELKLKVNSLSITKKNCISDNITEIEIPPDVKRKDDEIELIIDQAQQKGYNADQLVDLHKHYQGIIDTEDVSMTTAVWKPLSVEFKNMFGYGDNRINKINFKRGVTSIIAGNTYGKTSIVNILLFAIFGRTPLNPSTSTYTFDIINNKQTTGFVKILLKYGQQYILIERKTIRKSSRTTTTSVILQKLNKYDFTCEVWDSNINGDKLVNRSESRKNNNDSFITELFGDINEFSLSNLLNKESSLDLLSMTPSDQVKTLKKLFRMGIYDTYRELNKQQLNDIENLISKLKTKKQSIESLIGDTVSNDHIIDCQQQCKELQDKLIVAKDLVDAKQHEYNECNLNVKQLKKEIDQLKLNSKQDLSLTVNDIDIDLDQASAEAELLKLDNSCLISTSTGYSCDYLELQLKNLKDIHNTASLIKFSGTIDDLEQERNEVKQLIKNLNTLNSFDLNISEAKLNKKLGQLTAELKNVDNKDKLTSKPTLSKTEICQQIKQLKSEIIPLTSNLPLLELKLKQLTDNTNHLVLPENNLDMLKKQLSSLHADLMMLERKRDCNYNLKVSPEDDIHQLTLQINPDYGFLLHTVALNPTELDKFQKEIKHLMKSTAYDLEKLETCPIIDSDGKKQYGLDPTVEYCLVEDTIVDRLIDYLSTAAKPPSTSSSTSTSKINKMQAKIDQTLQAMHDNEIISVNIKLDKQIAQCRWLQVKENIQELTTQIMQLKQMQELQQITNEIAIHHNNEKIQSEISYLENTLHWYTNYEIKQEIQQIEKHLEYYNARSDLKDIEDEIDSLNQLNECNIKLPLLEQQIQQQRRFERKQQLKAIISRYHLDHRLTKLHDEINSENQTLKVIFNELQTLKSKASYIDNEYHQANERLSVLQFRYQQSLKLASELNEIHNQLTQYEKDIIPLQDYNEIMGNKGIASKLLFTKIKAIEEYINSVIQEFTRYEIIIIYDDKKQTINIISKNKNTDRYLSVSRLSGYEKLILQIAFKRALNKFSYNSKSSLIIIDEALDCIDQENFTTKLPDVMNLITQDYTTCLVISQRDILHISDSVIRVNRDQSSYVKN